MPSITVVTAAYNGERYLDQTIAGVCAQDCDDWELIVVDDGSTDRTPDIVREWMRRDQRIQYFRRNTPAGAPCPARNEGYLRSTATSAYLLFLDQDDLLKPDALACLRRTLQKDPAAVGVQGLVEYIDGDGHRFAIQSERSRCELRGKRVVRLTPGEPTTFTTLATTNCIHTPGCVMIRRESLHGRLPFPDSHPLVLDWDGWLALTRNGYMTQLSQVVLSYRRTPQSLSANTQKVRHRILATRRRVACDPAFTEEQRAFILHAMRPCELFHAWEKITFAWGSLMAGRAADACRQVAYGLRHMERWLRLSRPGKLRRLEIDDHSLQ
jgi:hypothetical protein